MSQLLSMQESMREGGLKKGFLPKIDDKTCSFIKDTVYRVIAGNKSIDVLPVEKEKVTEDLIRVAQLLVKKSKNELGKDITQEDDFPQIIVELLANQESIRILGISRNVKNQKQWDKWTHLLSSDFLWDFLYNNNYIAKELEMTPEEVADIFSKGLKMYFAVTNISNPIAAIKKVKDHLDTTLSNENIAKELGMSPEEVADVFSQSVKMHFAVNNISNPIAGIKKVKDHLENTLSNENIAKELEMTPEEVADVFSQSVKMIFAVNNISDPIAGIKSWIKGDITTAYGKFSKK